VSLATIFLNPTRNFFRADLWDGSAQSTETKILAKGTLAARATTLTSAVADLAQMGDHVRVEHKRQFESADR
jgi:hypothetical protein